MPAEIICSCSKCSSLSLVLRKVSPDLARKHLRRNGPAPLSNGADKPSASPISSRPPLKSQENSSCGGHELGWSGLAAFQQTNKILTGVLIRLLYCLFRTRLSPSKTHRKTVHICIRDRKALQWIDQSPWWKCISTSFPYRYHNRKRL
jgi:hypothetical protein